MGVAATPLMFTVRPSPLGAPVGPGDKSRKREPGFCAQERVWGAAQLPCVEHTGTSHTLRRQECSGLNSVLMQRVTFHPTGAFVLSLFSSHCEALFWKLIGALLAALVAVLKQRGQLKRREIMNWVKKKHFLMYFSKQEGSRSMWPRGSICKRG